MRNFFVLTCLSVLLTTSSNAQTLGLLSQNTGSLDGYVLFAPIMSNNTYLIDKCGKLVHSWTSTHHPGQSVYFLEDGTLLRPGSTGNTVFTSGGNGGIIEKFDWNSSLLWSFTISSATECQHHDIRPLPNGNILAVAWELKTVTEATNAGRNPSLIGTSLWSEKIIEIQPTGTATANIVWEWHVWDHLIQEFDAAKANYGTVSQHPELINLNYTSGPTANADWLHCNSIDYNPTLDQIIISSHNFNEVWIIDHSTTTSQAASHNGGTQGVGGDLLYRWGNPATYNRGTTADRKLFGQHNAHWIDSGLTGAGDLMIFNNGQGRATGNYSSVDIIHLPVNGSGNYLLSGNQSYQPDSAWWSYTAPTQTDFYSANISGAQRLTNGNTLICEGPQGTFFEINSVKNTVWKYINPVAQSGILTQGTTPAQNLVFRCTLYESSYSGFAGQTLIPGNPIEINPIANSCVMITGVNEIANDYKWNVSNPFLDKIIISSDAAGKDVTVVLFDLTGRLVTSWSGLDFANGKSQELKIKIVIAPGIYMLEVKDSGKNIRVKLVHQ